MMKKHGIPALATVVALGLLAAAPTQAQCPGGVCVVACVGGAANDLPLLDSTMSLAVPGDKIVVQGACSTAGYVGNTYGAWKVTKPVHIVGDCGSVIRKVGPALPTRNGCAMFIMGGASGAVIEGLTIQGNRHAINVGDTLIGAVDVLAQADNITIRNNHLIGVGGRGVSQFVANDGTGASPVNDPNPCAAPTCPPVAAMNTVADHWVIENNLIESTTEIGMVLCGNDGLIRNNYIKAPVRGINMQNNHSSPVAVSLGGAAPSNFRNRVVGNVIETDGIGNVEFGLDVFGGLVCAANPTRCDRGSDNVWEHNCNTLGSGGLAAVSIAYENSTHAHNSYTVLPGAFGNEGIEVDSSRGTVIEHNKFSGFDFSVVTFNGDEKNILVQHNRIGTGENQFVGGVGTYQLEDFSGVGSGNLWTKNHACELDDPGPSPPSYVSGTLIADDPAVDGGGNLLLSSLCGDPTAIPGNGIPGQPAKYCLPFQFGDPSYCQVKSSRRGSLDPISLTEAPVERVSLASGASRPASSCQGSVLGGLRGGEPQRPAEY